MTSVALQATDGLAVEAPAFFDQLRDRLARGEHLVTFYGRGGDMAGDVLLTAVFQDGARLRVLRAPVSRERGFPSLTREVPELHIFEREIYEQCGVAPHGHPWLKPVRFSGAQLGRTGDYPFYKLGGKEVQEVGVGPIHAGVIEPGHFRFMCLGETVHHLEIQLGFQHRGVEAELLKGAPWRLTPLVETVVGDSSVAHAWAYCSAVEALADVSVDDADRLSRGIGLELERVAMHLASLAGMCNDIAFLQGAASYGRLRTTAINTSMLLCGSRFGRGWLRPGCTRASMPASMLSTIRLNLDRIRTDVDIVNELFLRSRSVSHRLQDVGTVATAEALELGLVGLVARASGVALDARAQPGDGPYLAAPITIVTEAAGDCAARALVRVREIEASLGWLDAAVGYGGEIRRTSCAPRALAPSSLAVAICEGWRGEVVHAIETDSAGGLRHYKIQDPSLRNWFGLAAAVRNNDISDFPICNKSFDLSYCGHDL